MTARAPFPATPADDRERARRRLPRFLFDYLDGAAGEEHTLAENLAGLARVKLQPRVLVDVSKIDTRATLGGMDCALPLALAPVGLAGLMARRGEVQAARAAAACGVPFTLSTVGICSLAEVHATSPAPFWFQLYMVKNRAVVAAMLQRAWDVGCRTLVFTVDLPLPGMRHRDTRNGMGTTGLRAKLVRARQLLARPRWLWDVGVRGQPHTFGSLSAEVPDAHDLDAFKVWVDTQFDPSVTWADIAKLRAEWRGKLLLKGIMDTDDARRAVDCGADGIVVSNHGGRQLDSVAATIDKLPAIVAAVGKQTEVLVDGGIRSGTDLFKVLALGARGALIGRAWAWAMAGGGQRAVERMLRTMHRELELAMTLTGVTRVADIHARHLDRAAR